MKRKTDSNFPKESPQFIICSDMHIREDQPVSYEGDFLSYQWEVLDFITDVSDRYGHPIICAGDFFDYWKPSPFLLAKTIEHLPRYFYSIYGQHDLPQHQMDLKYKSGLYVLNAANVLHTFKETPLKMRQTHIYGVSWNGKVPDVKKEEDWINILVIHKFTYINTPPFPGAQNPALSMLKEYPQFDLIITGDNHQSFIHEHKGRVLINPGSIMRQSADQIDFQPKIYLYYSNEQIIPVNLPLGDGVFTRKHIERKEERDRRMAAFISRLSDEWKIGLSFEDNLKAFEETNEVDPTIMSIIWKAIDKCKS